MNLIIFVNLFKFSLHVVVTFQLLTIFKQELNLLFWFLFFWQVNLKLFIRFLWLSLKLLNFSIELPELL